MEEDQDQGWWWIFIHLPKMKAWLKGRKERKERREGKKGRERQNDLFGGVLLPRRERLRVHSFL